MKELIEKAWQHRDLLKEPTTQQAIREVIEQLDKGKLRVAEPATDGGWQVNEWVKQAILLYFNIQPMQTWEVKPFEFYDKILLKKNYKELGVRAVPHAVARYGAYVARNVVLMPSYVNIGASSYALGEYKDALEAYKQAAKLEDSPDTEYALGLTFNKLGRTDEEILAYRRQHGAFHSVEELDAVPGIGPARLQDLKPLVDL